MSLSRRKRFLQASLYATTLLSAGVAPALAQSTSANQPSANQTWVLNQNATKTVTVTQTQTASPAIPPLPAAPAGTGPLPALMIPAVPPAPADSAAPSTPDTTAPTPTGTDTTPSTDSTSTDSTSTDTTPPNTPQTDTPQPDATTKPVTAQPITVKLNATLPALIHGKKATLPLSDTLTIPTDVVAGVQKANQLTPEAAKLLSAYVAKAAAPADARFEQQEDGSWAIVQHNALSVDMVVAKLSLQHAILQGDTSFTMLPTVGKAPTRTLNYFASRGITDFLAAGQTNYDGSSKARMTNIHAGTHFFQDRLFEGKEFSFNQFIGPISEKAGYVPGLVIAGERTASGLGGGICQVSTTVFRALYGAGLSIKERRNHSYQVYYYAPQGLDATIYQPTQDLRFANDAGSLWFQSDWDDKTGDLVVRVFGKPRGFEVQIKEPRILSSTPAPADKIIVDKTLKPGERKQVDWAAKGAVIEVDRLFVKGSKTIHKDTLKSTYRPWPNIFLVGSKAGK